MLQSSKQNNLSGQQNRGVSRQVTIGGVKLNPMQAAYAQSVCDGMSGSMAAGVAGYSDPDNAHYRLSRDPKIQHAISSELQRLVITEAAPVGYKAALRLLYDGATPRGVQWKIAQWFMESAGARPPQHAASGQQTGHKALEDMTLAELEAIAQSARQRLETTPVIDGQARTVNAPDQQQRQQETVINDDYQDGESLLD